MMMSPSVKSGTSCSSVESTTAAGTMIHAARGCVSLSANSWSVVAPVAPSLSSCSHRVGADVVDDALVPVLHQPPDEVRAHPPESDHAELHRPLLYMYMGRSTGEPSSLGCAFVVRGPPDEDGVISDLRSGSERRGEERLHGHEAGDRHRRHRHQGCARRHLTRGRSSRTGSAFSTPHPATPDAVAQVVADIATHFDWTGPIGATFPAVVKDGVVQTAANVDKSWIGTDAAALLSKAAGAPVTVLNDADAAGMAEMEFGVGKGRDDTVIVITLGTGIGSAVFSRGHLVPNTELGHLKIRGKDAERRAAESVREAKQLSWKKWAERLNEYIAQLEALLWPDLIVVGGGVSKKSGKFLPLLTTRAAIVPAQLLNEAGIVGAAVVTAARGLGEPQRLTGANLSAGGSVSGVRPAKPSSGQCHHSIASSPSSQHSR